MRSSSALQVRRGIKVQRHRGTKAPRGILSAVVPQCLSAFTLYLCTFVPLFLLSCDAPHQNPLDPENPDNQYHYLQGTVRTLSIPHQPIEQATVQWPEQSLLTCTGSAGDFKLEMISPSDGWVCFNHEKYFHDSLYITWQNRKTVSIEHYLNALPQIDSLQIYSIILNRYPNLQTEQTAIRAKIIDRDNDTDSVLAINNFINSRQVLVYNINDKWYEKILSLYDLQISKTEEIVGHPFDILVKDIYNKTLIVGTGDIQRVIREEVVFISPSGNEVTPPQPILSWQKYLPGFNFYLQLQVYTSEIIPQLVWEKNQVVADSVSYTVDQMLPVGEYFWVIWAVDDFGNRTRSKPASFKVE
jgi:hypothetical protein